MVPNERIEYLKLEKVIDKDVHLDSDAEKGRRIQELIDKAQDAKIKANTAAIERLEDEKRD